LLTDQNIDESFLAYSLELPSINVLNSELELYDYDNVSKARNLFKESIGKAFNTEFNDIFTRLNIEKDYDITPKSMSERLLKFVTLAYIVFSGQTDAKDITLKIYENANNMTEELSSLKLLNHIGGKIGEKAISSFYDKWKSETLIMQKWLTIQSMEEKDNVLDIISKLEKSDVYNPKIPNLFRSLIIGFAALNPVKVNDLSGSGYKFIADKIIEVDKFNPQMGANLSKKLSHLDKLDPVRQGLLRAELTRILDSNPSKNTIEIIRTNLRLDLD
jgi:aminopeptidase N